MKMLEEIKDVCTQENEESANKKFNKIKGILFGKKAEEQPIPSQTPSFKKEE